MDGRPSARIRELIRQATAELTAHPEAMFADVDAAVLASQSEASLADAELTAAIRASNRSNLAHWAACNVARPGETVPPNVGEEGLALARIIARRGIEDTSRAAYGAGQNAAWSPWMAAVFSVTSDPDELREILEISSRSVFAFVESMLALLREQIERERGEVFSAANARRRAVIGRLLAGESAAALIDELGYRADTFIQTAVVLTLSDGPARLLELVRALAEALGPQLRGRPLAVVADADTVWAWFPSDDLELTDVLTDTLRRLPRDGARAAVGPSRPGWEGFRAHADALAARAVANAEVVSYAEVTLAALVRAEPDRVRRFIDTWTAGLSEDLADTLAAYLAHRCSPTATAAAIYAHRNTVIDRVRRAETILPAPIEGNELELALALELDRYAWEGHQPLERQ